MRTINKIKNKVKNTLHYYIFALLATILVLILWQGFREKPAAYTPVKTSPDLPKVSEPKIDLNQKVFFASNGKDTAYKLKKGDKWSILFKGTESNEYDFVSGGVFSEDGKQFAFSAESGNQSFVVVNNAQEISAYQGAGYIVFNSSGSTIAFVSSKEDSYVIITSSVPFSTDTQTISGEETESFDQVGTAIDSEGNMVSIIFSEDGDEFAYIIEKDDGVCIVVDGEESEVYDSISDISLDDDGSLSYTAEDDGQTIIVVDDTVTSTTDNNNESSSSDNSSANSDSSSSSTYSNSDDDNFNYKIITDVDIDRSSETIPDEKASCAVGQNCNF